MEPEGDGRPERPELLVIVVDVANIRPRHKSDKDGQRSSGPTSLKFIDLCLNSIQLAARGAIVVKFADRSLLDALPAADREEVLRRSDLHFAEPDKIFLVPYADRPILASAHDLEATIVSNDRFRDPKLDEFKVSEVRHFRHHFDKADNSFNFPDMSDGRQLDRWWSLQFRDVPDMWFVSDEYLEIDWQLRDRVHEVTFEWRSEPLTYRPEVPTATGKGIPPVLETRDLQEVLPPGRVPVDAIHGTAEQAPHTGVVRRKLRLPVVFIDDLESVKRLHGEEARVVGRLGRGTDGGLLLQWFEGGPHAIFAPLNTPTSVPVGTWVSVPCRVDDTDVVSLELLRGAIVESLSFEEVLTLRNNMRSTPTSPPGKGTWAVPGFARPLVYLNLLRRRGGSGRARTGNLVRDDSGTRRLRLVAVFRDGREVREERWLTDEEETLARLEYEDRLQQWKSTQTQEEKRRRQEAEAERKKRDEELAEQRRKLDEWLEKQRVEHDERKRELVKRREREREEQKRLQEAYLAEQAAAQRRKIMVAVLVITIVAAVAVMLVSTISGGDGAGAMSAVAVSSGTVITGHKR